MGWDPDHGAAAPAAAVVANEQRLAWAERERQTDREPDIPVSSSVMLPVPCLITNWR